MNVKTLKLVVLISGRGSNLSALLERIEGGELNAQVVAVLSNKPEAKGLELAKTRNIPSHVISHKDFTDRASFDLELQTHIEQYNPDLVILAGFMRVLAPAFVQHFFPRLINIHPSLLPAFTGLHTHERAIAEGVKVHGCTVHAVTAELDHGPILGQGVVPVYADDTEETLSARVLSLEHQLLPAVIQAISQQAWQMSEKGWSYQHSKMVAQIPISGFLNIG